MASGTAAASPFVPDERFARPAGEDALRRAAAALTAKGFTVEILDDVGLARARLRDLLPEGATVFTSSSETLRVSGIEDDLNASGRYQAVKPLVRAMDRATRMDEIRVLVSTPDVVVGSVAAGYDGAVAGRRDFAQDEWATNRPSQRAGPDHRGRRR